MFQFKQPFLYENEKFNNSRDLAFYLMSNYNKALSLVDNRVLETFFVRENSEFWNTISAISRDFIYKENTLTLIVALLEPTFGFVTKTHQFLSIRNIADHMKKIYPKVDNENKVL